MHLLGISSFYHDSAATLIRDGTIVAAAQEERFTRVKHDASFPTRAIEYCLSGAGLRIDDVDHVSFYEDTHLKFDRIVRTYVRYLPGSLFAFHRALSYWLVEKVHIETELARVLGYRGPTSFVRHHLSHAASAFYPSPFDRAAVLVIDGVGEWASTTIARGEGSHLEILKEVAYPHSLGMLYSAFTQFAGFRVNADEYKLMGLAPYGEPIYRQAILDHLVDLKEDGSYRLNLRYFRFHRGASTINRAFEALFKAPARSPDQEIRRVDCDVAASIQAVLDEAVLRLARTARRVTGEHNLAMAGGVALNCVANGLVAAQGIFDHVWAQPAAGDAGGALGCALYAYYGHLQQPRRLGTTSQGASLLGPSFDDEAVRHYLELFGIRYREIPTLDRLYDELADLLQAGRVVAMFQGRMEFGPRALGARSILGDPRQPDMQRKMNLSIKYRESFRPFAPAVLKEHCREYFEMDYHSPYMQFVVPVAAPKRLAVAEGAQLEGLARLYQKRSVIPAVTHVDYSARVQVVDREENPVFHAILDRFYQKTGCPVLINTSFNVSEEPIVCTPEDALRCYFSSEIDVLALNRFLVFRDEQDWEAVGHLFRSPERVELG